MSRPGREAVGAALSEVWRRQLQEMLACESGVIAGTDSEVLHRLRVALRTTRALLRLFQRYLPAPATVADAVAHELAWLSDTLNAARDLDIIAEFVQRVAASSSPRERRMAVPLQRELQSQRAEQRRALAAVLRGRRYRRLVARWCAFIELCRCADAGATISYTRFATAWQVIGLEQLVRMLRRLRKIDEQSTPAELHRLRIRAKRLRYLFEACPQRPHDKNSAAVANTFVTLQRALGEHQDAVVIRAWLQRVAERKLAVDVPSRWYALLEEQCRRALAALPEAQRQLVKHCADI